MLATIQKHQSGYSAQFTWPLSHSISEVWAVLTKNGKLQKWMSNLEMIEPKKNGKMRFNMNDGTDTFIDIDITDYIEQEVLEFEWGKDSVRFELSPTSDGSILVLHEKIGQLTDHTPKDLAGWHICLELLSDLLNDSVHGEFPMEAWQKWLAEYTLLIHEVEK
ncbi:MULTISPECIES: SRPBCC family protein [unclassified Lysinibacillus]|uniref:SRPBCC family protein n=1 Tax=unclassified Lysinibacillus TaxID=2636778 RepID=UPI00381E0564